MAPVRRRFSLASCSGGSARWNNCTGSDTKSQKHLLQIAEVRRCEFRRASTAGYGVLMSGKQIKLFLIDGTPGGLTTAEITNWTGHVLSARRSDLADLLAREEAQHTGAYLLLGDDEEAVGGTRCYIGEADIVADWLRHHQRKKEFWDRVVVVTSKVSTPTEN
jgi:hypothetical protein